MSDPKTQTEFLQGLPIPWLAGNSVGQANAGALGQVLDGAIDQLRQSVKAHMPSLAPLDALPYIGGDRKLIQGPTETTASFRIRCKDAWAQWQRAGTACSVLEQIAYYLQSNSAVWVQQNGLAYTLSAMPTPGVNPMPLLVISNLSATAAVMTSTAPPYRTIPAGTPWFAFDGNTDMCNRFAIIFPGPLPAAFGSITGTATFAGTSSAVMTWSQPVGGSYFPMVGQPVITDGGVNVALSVDGTSETATSVTINASRDFTGYVTGTVLGMSAIDVNNLQILISAFRPNAICMGVSSLTTGKMIGFSGLTLGSGATLGGSVISQILGVF